MRYIIRVAFALVGSLTILRNAYPQSNSRFDYQCFIPNGYDTLYVTKGDLNGDGHDDIVLVCSKKYVSGTEEEEDTNSRPMIVLFWSASGYQFVVRNDDVILCKGCGGLFGDPFAGIEIKKGVLTISHYGGSAWRWEFVRKFKRVEGDLVLIGKTNHGYWDVEFCKSHNDYAGTDLTDVNLITGKRHRKKISQECKLVYDKWDTIETRPLVPLSKYMMKDTSD